MLGWLKSAALLLVPTMSDQTSFGFLAKDISHPRRMPSRTNNLFLALKPTIGLQLVDSVSFLVSQLPPDARRMSPDRLHISLVFLGVHPKPSRRLVDEVEGRMQNPLGAPIRIAFDRLSCFGGKAIVLRGGPIKPILRLRAILAERLSFLPVVKESARRAFEPHMTVVYSARRFAELAVEPYPWHATEVTLIHSHHGHRPLAAWPLAAAANVPSEPRPNQMDLFD